MTSKVRRARGTSKVERPAEARKNAGGRRRHALPSDAPAFCILYEDRDEWGDLRAEVRVAVPGLPPLPLATPSQRRMGAARAGDALRAMYEVSLLEKLEARADGGVDPGEDVAGAIPDEGVRACWLVLRREAELLQRLEEYRPDPRLASVAAIVECAAEAYADPYRGAPDDRLDVLAKLAARLLRKRGPSRSLPTAQQDVLESARDSIMLLLPVDPSRVAPEVLERIASSIISGVAFKRSALRLSPPASARTEAGFHVWWRALHAKVKAHLSQAVRRGLPRTKSRAAERLIVTALRAAWPESVARKAKHVFNFDDRDA